MAKSLKPRAFKPAKPLPRKREFLRDGDGACFNCGRQNDFCKCGVLVELTCSKHGEQLNVIALPVYHDLGDSVRAIVGWVDAAECPIAGCDTLRAVKWGQGVERNKNVKGGR